MAYNVDKQLKNKQNKIMIGKPTKKAILLGQIAQPMFLSALRNDAVVVSCFLRGRCHINNNILYLTWLENNKMKQTKHKNKQTNIQGWRRLQRITNGEIRNFWSTFVSSSTNCNLTPWLFVSFSFCRYGKWCCNSDGSSWHKVLWWTACYNPRFKNITYVQ